MANGNGRDGNFLDRKANKGFKGSRSQGFKRSSKFKNQNAKLKN